MLYVQCCMLNVECDGRSNLLVAKIQVGVMKWKMAKGKWQISKRIRVPANQWAEYQIISISESDALVC